MEQVWSLVRSPGIRQYRQLVEFQLGQAYILEECLLSEIGGGLQLIHIHVTDLTLAKELRRTDQKSWTFLELLLELVVLKLAV